MITARVYYYSMSGSEFEKACVDCGDLCKYHSKNMNKFDKFLLTEYKVAFYKDYITVVKTIPFIPFLLIFLPLFIIVSALSADENLKENLKELYKFQINYTIVKNRREL